MSGQIKLSKVFYVDPTSLPIPQPSSIRFSLSDYPYSFHDLKKDILTNGFDSKRPIIVRESTIVDGNHRLSIALELGLDHVPVRFK